MLLGGLDYFRRASGLEANRGKYEVFAANMASEEIDQICQVAGFQRGKWPFKYLGTPICNRKISRSDCDLLVHKMTMRIRGWQTRHLSFAGRLQLVNSMLMSICTCWMQILILPGAVLKEINGLCRKFLWEGHLHGSKPGYVSWETVCKPKSKGGLGVRDLHLWNLLAVGKLVWQIEKKKDSLWVKWVHNIYIRGQVWWDYRPSILASWIWKSICKVKEMIKVMDMSWWPRNENDYKVGKAYKHIKNQDVKEKWASIIWNRYSLPKHNFIWWLAIKRRLLVKQRLYKYGVCHDPWCLHCQNQEESHDHLLFCCPYAQEVWDRITGWLHINRRWDNMHQLAVWYRRFCRTTKMRSKIIIAVCAATVYSLWKVRNEIMWEKRHQKAESIVEEIKYFVMVRCNALVVKNKLAKNDVRWLSNLANCN
ncbi:hypothetical protein RDABS01_028736 [Bienertia sinuspersici]